MANYKDIKYQFPATAITSGDIATARLNNAPAETKPVVSRLRLFWETTTSGLISEINKAIIEGMGGKIQGTQKDGPIIQQDYEVFITTRYKDVIEGLSDDTIKKNYNTLFD